MTVLTRSQSRALLNDTSRVTYTPEDGEIFEQYDNDNNDNEYEYLNEDNEETSDIEDDIEHESSDDECDYDIEEFKNAIFSENWMVIYFNYVRISAN